MTWIGGSYSGVGVGGKHPQSETRQREGTMKGAEVGNTRGVTGMRANEGVASRQKRCPGLGTDS